MAKYLKYWGEFDGQDGVLTRVEIYQEALIPFDVIGELKFPAEEPLKIEWTEVDKLEPVQTSQATLTLRSVIDRQYIDLYTIEVGSIRMDVMRNGVLYWSGTLDPEFYEEPFSYLNEYDVSLTFTDFGILDRIDFVGSGYATFQSVLEKCLAASLVNYTSVQKYISTIRSGTTGDILESTSINQGNYFDEDGVASSLRDVLDSILRPFSLRLLQKNGKVFIYDLNAIYTAVEREAVQWDADDAMLGVDKVYNQAKIVFSPYEKTSLLDEDLSVQGLSVYQSNLLFRLDMHSTNGFMDNLDGFFINLYDATPSPTNWVVNSRCKIFKINPANSGEFAIGVAWRIRRKDTIDGAPVDIVDNIPKSATREVLLKSTKRIDTPVIGIENVGGVTRPDVLVKISQPFIFDCRYNPYESSSDDNDQDVQDALKNIICIAIPFRLRIKSETGEVLMHYENVMSDDKGLKKGEWVNGDYSDLDPSIGVPSRFAVLCYYNASDYKSGYPSGWQNNNIPGVLDHWEITTRQKRLSGADFIEMPTNTLAGILDYELLSGVYYMSRNLYNLEFAWSLDSDIFPEIRTQQINNDINWMMYKPARIVLTDYNGKDIDSSDIEYTSWINKKAKEDIEIDTITGSVGKQAARGLGIMLSSSDLSLISTFTRNGVTDYIERLLLGTIYSNYYNRKNVLSGTVKMLDSFGIYTDTSQPGYYCLLSETQKIREATSEIKMVEFEKDNYQGIDV